MNHISLNSLHISSNKSIAHWINRIIVNVEWDPSQAGLYIWNRNVNVGRTVLMETLSKIIDYHHWSSQSIPLNETSPSKQCQFEFQPNPDLVIMDSMYSVTDFPVVHSLTNGRSVQIDIDFDRTGIINAYTPFIITARCPPEELDDYYHGWSDNILIVEIEDNLFELDNLIREIHEIEPFFETPIPDILNRLLNPILNEY